MRATIVAMMLIAAVMYWREGFYTGSLLQQWILHRHRPHGAVVGSGCAGGARL